MSCGKANSFIANGSTLLIAAFMLCRVAILKTAIVHHPLRAASINLPKR